MNTTNLEPELRSLLSKLTVEIEKDSKEIEIRKKRIEKNEALLRAVKGSLGTLNPSVERTVYGAKSEIILDAIKRLPKPQFTQDELEAEIKRSNPGMDIHRSRIRAALWTFASKKERIRQIGVGTNQKPAVYEKIEGIPRFKRVTEQDKEQTLKDAGLGA